MGRFQFGDYQDVDFRSRNPVLEMESDGFADVLIEFVHGAALRKDVFPNPTRAPRLAVVIDFNLHQHVVILTLRHHQANHFERATDVVRAVRMNGLASLFPWSIGQRRLSAVRSTQAGGEFLGSRRYGLLWREKTGRPDSRPAYRIE